MAVSWLVTIRAITKFISETAKVISMIGDANKEMKSSAQELCTVWRGAAAEAFAAEQGVLGDYCAQLVEVTRDYSGQIEKARANYEQAEQEAAAAIRKV